MRKIMKKIKFYIDQYCDHGWLGIYCLYFPVYWKQDSGFQNNGCDILSLKDKKGAYTYGTYKKRRKLWMD